MKIVLYNLKTLDTWQRRTNKVLWPENKQKGSPCEGAKKVIFTACHSGKLKLAFTNPNIISTPNIIHFIHSFIHSFHFILAPNIFGWAELVSEFFCKLNSSKYFTCPSGKLRTEFTSPIAKSTSPGLSDTTFFARCMYLHNREDLDNRVLNLEWVENQRKKADLISG